MKKVIYSIVTALILSVILTLLNPQCFFKNDARWTYQNDAACLDISFSGHLKRGRVGVAGENLRVGQPARLTNSDYQGTCVEMPVSYRKRIYQIKLTPQADEWGTDVALVIKFMGQDFQHKGHRKPAWVCFRNISLNGELVAAEKVVWYNEPFVLKYPSHTSEITLIFDVSKPLAASDVSFKNLLGIFLACLMLCLLFASPKASECHIPGFIYGKDIVKVLSDGYRHIDPVYRRSFWIIFGVLCFAFGFHTIQFMWGNHDWNLLEHKHRWLEWYPRGRYLLYSVKASLSNGVYLPLIYDFITFLTLALNAVMLCKYWRMEKKVTYYVLCGLVLTVQPFTLCMMYYVHMLPEVFIGVTCALTALLLSEKIVSWGISWTKKVVYSIIAIALINFTLAMYPALITTITVVFSGRLLVLSFDWDGAWQKLKSYSLLFTISVVNIVLGITSYKLVLTYVFPVTNSYNTETLPLEQVPERLGVTFRQCFHQLYEYDYPFVSQWILWCFLGFAIILALYICAAGNIKQKVVRLILLFGSLYATQTAMIIAKTHLIDGRVELFGLVFFEMLVMVLVITRLRQLHNLWVIAGTCIVSVFIINDLDCLRIWKLGYDAEKMLWNRVLARLEVQKDFSPGKRYRIIQIGNPISMRPRYYTGSTKQHGHTIDLLYSPYDKGSNIFGAHEFFYPMRFRSSMRYERPSMHSKYVAELRRLYQAGVLQKAEVWPKPNGLIVWKNVILFVTDGKRLVKYKRQFEQEKK